MNDVQDQIIIFFIKIHQKNGKLLLLTFIIEPRFIPFHQKIQRALEQPKVGTGSLDLRRKNKVRRIHPLQPRPPKLTITKKVLPSLYRASKIFKQMSLFVKTRNPSQCRSQNQKVYRRFKTTRKIVSVFKQ